MKYLAVIAVSKNLGSHNSKKLIYFLFIYLFIYLFMLCIHTSMSV